jgi:DNA polymerase I-like protein with 3'-5' exonuclease and polymerase domains/uracil-DNA glycosylase
MTILTAGNKDAKIYVLCEPPTEGNYNPLHPTTAAYINRFLKCAVEEGFQKNEFYFIKLCDPIPENIKASKAKTWKFIEPYLEQLTPLLDEAKAKGKFIVPMGDLATRAVMGKAHAITKCRGTVLRETVYPIFSAGYIFRSLEQEPTFRSDIATLKKLSVNDFDIDSLQKDDKNYFWCTDLSFLLNNKPKLIAVDTETTGLDVVEPSFQVLTCQIGYDEHNVALVPLHKNFWPEDMPDENVEYWLRVLKAQLKEILEDPTIKKVGHNLNYDISALEREGIYLKGVLADTQLLAWFLDENMFSKSLDDCVRRWYPPMAGYNDHWNACIDKSKMIDLPRDTMLQYGGGDAYVSRHLFLVMWKELQRNPRQMNLFLKLKMPGLLAFRQMERAGIEINKLVLDQLKIDIKNDLDELEKTLKEKVPKAVIRKHMDPKKGPKFTRDAFVRDILFSKDGFNLTPVVFTKGTAKNENEEERLPSVSAKDHLPYFTDAPGIAGDFVNEFIEFKKLTKLHSTYVRDFYDKYVKKDGKIHPQFVLHITTTGRTSSRGPNAQNFPARGKWSKPYKKIFSAGDGYTFISADLSQIELRLIAWESGDPVMLDAYLTGKDIHKITAMAVSGHTEDSWSKLTKEEQKLLRYRAKAVNFGFCYGMGWRKFQRYAKTDYQLDLTEEQAQLYYKIYHNLYKRIKSWHSRRMNEVAQKGYVVSLHGSVRHLASARSGDKMIRAQAERQAVNTPIQCFGSDLGVLAIARIARQVDLNTICPVAFIHDDIILRVKDGHEEEAVNMLLYVLNDPPLHKLFDISCPVPILAEPDIGKSLGEMYELYDLPDEMPEWYKPFTVNPSKPSWWDDAKDLV